MDSPVSRKLQLDLPQGTPTETGILAACLEDSFLEWTENFAKATDALMTWRPYPGAAPAGGILLHMCSCERFWLDLVVFGQKPDPTSPWEIYSQSLDQDNDVWPDAPEKPLAWYLDTLKQHRAKSLDMIRQHQDPHSRHSFHGHEFTFAWIVGHLLQHDSYHGGQLSMLESAHRALQGKSFPTA